jgi:tetratricopeptide (TPR) repeat protein
MAPEQRRGVWPDARSDQYSFCVVLHEALYGKRPAGPPTRRADVPAWVRRALTRGLLREPHARYGSMHALIGALERDPRAGWKRAGLAAFVATLVVCGALGWRRHALAESCDETGKVARGTFSDARAENAREAFVHTGLSYAEPTWTSVRRTLSTYVASWTSLRGQVCTEKLSGGASELVRRQEQCLSDRLQELEASVQLFEHADRSTVQNAVPVVEALVPVARCADARSLSALPDATKAKEVLALKSELARARALNGAGHYHEARAVVESAARAADALDYRPIQAEAQALLGAVDGRDGDAKAAEAALLRAAALADTVSDDRLRATAWIGLMYQVGYEQLRYDSVALFDQQARAALERLGGDDRIEARRRSTMGLLLKSRGNVEAAQVELEAAIALKRATLPAESDEIAVTLVNLGATLRQQARYDEALKAFNEARAIYEKRRGADAPMIGLVSNDIADALGRQGELASALEQANRALAIGERQLAPDHPNLAIYLGTRAEIFNALQRYEEARADSERAMALIEKRFGADHPRNLSMLTELGKAHLGLGHVAQALSLLERAYTLSRLPTDVLDQAEAEFALARALRAAGRDRPRSDVLATSAEAGFQRVGDRRRLEALAAWRREVSGT